MGLFSKKTVRELTEAEEKQIKDEMRKQILTKSENDILMIKQIRDLTNMNVGDAKDLFNQFRSELYGG
ncbi:hypothetical protein [Listeria booriae]|uniref:Uncharacterized protein n=1 Tax=Listeria booriae TaxID=1552123 RepID=A0A7X1CIW0_9LIST|nr:hypothetical protein [Listeria booriae]MBC1210782.1 hypothetical protein [Listeria booriae]MBC1227450.1 hypothetical protein [Listeria booriae]MBC1232050.1 hypothetical protein [Listeria booriae]MBC1575466.1 hypothetical protein [Listeria booriae]MBC1779396.1 hypothetical protein [Listeria booriae]